MNYAMIRGYFHHTQYRGKAESWIVLSTTEAICHLRDQTRDLLITSCLELKSLLVNLRCLYLFNQVIFGTSVLECFDTYLPNVANILLLLTGLQGIFTMICSWHFESFWWTIKFLTFCSLWLSSWFLESRFRYLENADILCFLLSKAGAQMLSWP